ncbi:MAG TPA: hypothetical protein DCM45_04860 [Clostridiales bacterium]|nr:hypothetical protein [Clostridiales bacterium]
MVNTRKTMPKILLLLIVLTVLLLAASTVHAEKDFVVDQADLFSEADEVILQAQAASLGAKYAMDVVIVTTNNAEGKSAMAYADDYFDYNGYGIGENHDGLLMLIDMDNRQVWISTSGKAIDIFTDARIEGILDDIFAGDKMANGDYYGAARAFLKSIGSILLGNTLTPVEALISLLASGGVGASIFGGVRGKYKGRNTRPVFEYQRNSLVNYGLVTDNLFNTYVTQRIIPRPASTGGGRGGSSTHTSSSGGTHGGGGRGF